jgi:hypothetical protein
MSRHLDKILNSQVWHKHDADEVFLSSGVSVEIAMAMGVVPDIWKADVAAIRAIAYATIDAGDDIGNFITAYVYQWDATSVAADDGAVILQPTDGGANPGRWIAQKILIDTALSQIIYNKSLLNCGVIDQTLATPYYQATSSIVDTVGDRLFINIANSLRFSRCTVANITKGGGTWIDDLSFNTTGIATFGNHIYLGGADRNIFNTSNHALVFGTNNTAALQIDNTQALILGAGVYSFTNAIQSRSHFHNVNANAAYYWFTAASSVSAAHEVGIILGRMRGSIVVKSQVLNGDTIGKLYFVGYQIAGAFGTGAYIGAIATGNFNSATNVPTDLIFATGSTTSAAIERMRINNTGLIGINNTAPTYLITGDRADVRLLKLVSTALSGSTAGGRMFFGVNDGAAMALGDRLGEIFFVGASDNVNTVVGGAEIYAVTSATWSSSNTSTDLCFAITSPSTFDTRILAMKIDSLANICIGGVAGATAQKVLSLTNAAVSPTTSVNIAQLFAKDTAAGNATLALFTEQVVAAVGTDTPDYTHNIWINNVEYKIFLKAV